MSLLSGRKALLIDTGRKAGLGNRVRALLSAKALADAEGRELFYVWSSDRYFGPRMDELWRFAVGRRISRPTIRSVGLIAPTRGTDFSRLSGSDRQRRLWVTYPKGSELDLPSGVTTWQEEFRALEPVPEIADRVLSTFDSRLRDRPYVGVQVRTHAVSHAKTIESSPVDWFADRMRTIRAEHPGVVFFLSCDTSKAQASLMAEFDDCVALNDKGGYNTLEGVRSSLVDLYLLASSQHLIGASFSSFVEMAVFLCDRIVPFERPNQPLTGPVDLGLGFADDPLRPALRRAVG